MGACESDQNKNNSHSNNLGNSNIQNLYIIGEINITEEGVGKQKRIINSNDSNKEEI